MINVYITVHIYCYVAVTMLIC